MRDDAKPWDICDDCLGPMADDLDLLIERFGKPCDLTRIDQIDAERDKILKSAALNGGTLTEQQRTCCEDLICEAREIGRPPEPIDVERIFSSGNRLHMGTEWLAKTVSKKYATDLEAATREPLRQFYRLSVAARQVLQDEESTYPIHRLCGDLSANSVDFPLHVKKIEEGNASVEAGLREAAKRLRQAYAVAEAKMSQMLDSRTVRASIAEMSEPKQSAQTTPIPVAATKTPKRSPKPKTILSHSNVLLISALTVHHKYVYGLTARHMYSSDNDFNSEPIGSNKLAQRVKVDKRLASKFFKEQFGSHAAYKRLCKHDASLIYAIRMLNGEITPAILDERRGAERIDPDTLPQQGLDDDC